MTDQENGLTIGQVADAMQQRSAELTAQQRLLADQLLQLEAQQGELNSFPFVAFGVPGTRNHDLQMTDAAIELTRFVLSGNQDTSFAELHPDLAKLSVAEFIPQEQWDKMQESLVSFLPNTRIALPLPQDGKLTTEDITEKRTHVLSNPVFAEYLRDEGNIVEQDGTRYYVLLSIMGLIDTHIEGKSDEQIAIAKRNFLIRQQDSWSIDAGTRLKGHRGNPTGLAEDEMVDFLWHIDTYLQNTRSEKFYLVNSLEEVKKN